MALSFLNYRLNSPFFSIEDISVPDGVELFIYAESGKTYSFRERKNFSSSVALSADMLLCYFCSFPRIDTVGIKCLYYSR
jgi:hypothetical protein